MLLLFPVGPISPAHVRLALVLLVLLVRLQALPLVQPRQPIGVLELAPEDPVAPEEVEVYPDKRRQGRRQEPDVYREEAGEGGRAGHVPTEQEVNRRATDERRVGADLHTHHGGPEAVLVPPE